MTTTTVEEVPAVTADDEEWRQPDHPEKIARTADERWRIRRRRIAADREMDPRRRGAYLDRTLISITDSARLLGVSEHRISTARGGRKTARDGTPVRQRQWPHPSVFPPPARVHEYVAGRPVYRWRRGEVIEWSEKRGLYLLDLETGELTKMRNRAGRPRISRTARSKPHVPGTPRKNKKTPTPEDTGG